jgi:hypothetical protein
MLGIQYHGTKLEAKARDSVLNNSAEEKKHGIPFCGTKIQANTWNSVPNYSAEEITTRNSDENILSISVCWSRIICKTNFFHAISFRSELRNRLFRKPRNASE